jgi:hypothetical protein
MVLVAPKKKRSTSVHDKRRRGEHHQRSHDYHRAYWPYLPMALIVGLGIFANSMWGAIQHHVLSYATSMSVSGLLQETNEERQADGLGGLTLNSKLNSAAEAKARDMAARDYWSHNTPDGDAPWVFISMAGYDYKSAGENLAYGFDSSTEAIAGWMASPGHKANILNTGYTEVGFGTANASDFQGTGPQTIVVAMYATPTAVAAPTKKASPAPSKPAPTPVKQAAEPKPAPKEEAEPNTTAAAPSEDTKPAEAAPSAPLVEPQKVARIQLLSGNAAASWSAFAASAIATIAIAIFFLRHGLLLHRVLVKSGAFIHKHPFLDIALVAVATLGFVLTRTDGIIR